MADTQKEVKTINKAQESEKIQPESVTPNKVSPKKKMKVIILASVCVVLVGLIAFAVIFGIPYYRYKEAVKMMEAGDFENAMVTFYKLDDFMYSAQMHTECRYRHAMKLFESGQHTNARVIFEELSDYKESKNMVTACKYTFAVSLLEKGDYDEAVAVFEELADYEDSKDKINECHYLKANKLFEDKSYEDAQKVFEAIKDYKDSKDKIKDCKYNIAVKLIDEGNIVDAYKKLTDLKGHKKAEEKAKSIEPAYNRIKAKSKIFVNKLWIPPDRERSHFQSLVIDDNTIEFRYSGAMSLMEHIEETMIATWDESTGKLNYSGSICYFTAPGTRSVVYSDGSGCFYYENGYLCFVNNKNESSGVKYYG